MKRSAFGCDIRIRLENVLTKVEQPTKKIAFVGIDYHLNSLSITVMVEGKKKVHETVRLKNNNRINRKYLR